MTDQVAAGTTIYDHPLYYDILFGWDRTPEADFYEAVLQRAGVTRSDAVLEVACGSGQVARLLARRGWRVCGLDLREGMVAFLAEQARAEGLAIEARTGDMTVAFADGSEFAAAYNPMSSFRLLHDDAAVAAHLDAMAHALRPGGIYVLDMEFLGAADTPAITTDEDWEMERDGVTVRAEDEAVRVFDGGRFLTLPWGEEVHLRGYTSEAFVARVEASGRFAIDSWHPEAGRNGEGVSLFDIDHRAGSPVVGRAMVVLRRR